MKKLIKEEEINRVLEIDALSSREKNNVQLRILTKSSTPREKAPSKEYSPLVDITILQHAIIALIFQVEKEGIIIKGKLFREVLDSFKEMYTSSTLHDSMEATFK